MLLSTYFLLTCGHFFAIVFIGGETMKERIVQLRKELKLSQAAFAEKINLSRNFIGLVECGERNISERTIVDICEVFHVNKEWLLDGNGDIFKKRTRNQEIGAFANEVMKDVDSSFKKRFILALSKLDESDWETLEKIIDSIKKEDR